MSEFIEDDCDICQLLPEIPQHAVIAESKSWLVNLAFQDQRNLGRSYIALKRHASELDELTKDEEEQFVSYRNILLGATRRAFNPITFNIMCLKNDAFRSDPDATPSRMAHVHWHIVPRYGTLPVEFGGELFQDPAPGRYLPLSDERQPVSDAVAKEIVGAIQAQF